MRLMPALSSLALLLATSSMVMAEPLVVTSIKPVQSLVAAVMKGVGEPNLIVEGAGSPHGYNLRPSQAVALQEADLIVRIGPELETFLDKPIETIAHNAQTLDLIDVKGVLRLPPRAGGAFETHEHTHGEHARKEHEKGAEHEDHHSGDYHSEDHGAEASHEHAHERIDPHAWLDPVNGQRFLAAIADKLAEIDPENAATYAANARSATESLAALNREISAMLTPVRDRGFVVFHDAYQYFENRFDIHASGSITVNPELSPGAERIGEIQAKVRELGATCVFSEPQFQSDIVSVVMEGSSAQTGVLDPLGSSLESGPELYPNLIRGLATSMRDCLSGRR